MLCVPFPDIVAKCCSGLHEVTVDPSALFVTMTGNIL